MRPRPTVLYITEWHFPTGGIEVFLSGLIPHIAKSRSVVVAVRLYGQGELPLPQRDQVRVVAYRTYGELTNLIASANPEIVHFQHSTLQTARLARWLRRKRVPTVLTLHQVPTNLPGGLPQLTVPFLWLFLRYITAAVTRVVSPSVYIQRLARRHHLHSLAGAISCGVDTGRFRPGDQALARAKVGLPTEGSILLYVGRFGHEKNVDELVRAVALLPSPLNAHLVLVGFAATLSSSKERDLKEGFLSLRAKGRLTELGSLSHEDPRLPLVYQAADVFVMPSIEI